MEVMIHKDSKCTVKVEFDKKPAVYNFYIGDSVTAINICGEFIQGDLSKRETLLKWMANTMDKFNDILWEWNIGNDNFNLIDDPVLL